MPVAYGYSLLSPDEISATREDYAKHPELDWSRGWVPLLRDPSGNYIVVDLDGRETGVSGQVLAVWHDDPEVTVIAYDLASWLETLVTMFERGKIPPADAEWPTAGFNDWSDTHRHLFGCDPLYFRRRVVE
jgi:cell wall assembly regulator SMI1